MKPNPLVPSTSLKRTVWKRTPDPNSRSEMSRLTPDEEAGVRLALDVLRAQYGGEWKAVAAALKSNKRQLTKLTCKETRITPTYALRIARLLGEPLGAILSGDFQGRHECPTCGAVTVNGRAAPVKSKGRGARWRLVNRAKQPRSAAAAAARRA